MCSGECVTLRGRPPRSNKRLSFGNAILFRGVGCLSRCTSGVLILGETGAFVPDLHRLLSSGCVVLLVLAMDRALVTFQKREAWNAFSSDKCFNRTPLSGTDAMALPLATSRGGRALNKQNLTPAGKIQ